MVHVPGTMQARVWRALHLSAGLGAGEGIRTLGPLLGKQGLKKERIRVNNVGTESARGSEGERPHGRRQRRLCASEAPEAQLRLIPIEERRSARVAGSIGTQTSWT